VLRDEDLVVATAAQINTATGTQAADGAAEPASGTTSAGNAPPVDSAAMRDRERVRITANWDPVFPGEKVSWYNEYIQRHGPAQINWLQLPYHDGDDADDRDSGNGKSTADFVEARGVALYYPDAASEADGSGTAKGRVFAVCPLDDGSVCLWDVGSGGSGARKGAIVARSKPGILFIDGPRADNSKRSKRVDSGVTECVSVDSWMHRAFFAVQSRKWQRDIHLETVKHAD